MRHQEVIHVKDVVKYSLTNIIETNISNTHAVLIWETENSRVTYVSDLLKKKIGWESTFYTCIKNTDHIFVKFVERGFRSQAVSISILVFTLAKDLTLVLIAPKVSQLPQFCEHIYASTTENGLLNANSAANVSLLMRLMTAMSDERMNNWKRLSVAFAINHSQWNLNFNFIWLHILQKKWQLGNSLVVRFLPQMKTPHYSSWRELVWYLMIVNFRL